MAFVAVQVVGEVFRMKFGESRIVNSNLFDNAEEVESVEGAFILQREILEIHALLAAQLSPWSSHDETYTVVFSRVGLDRISSRYGVQLCDTLIVEGVAVVFLYLGFVLHPDFHPKLFLLPVVSSKQIRVLACIPVVPAIYFSMLQFPGLPFLHHQLEGSHSMGCLQPYQAQHHCALHTWIRSRDFLTNSNSSSWFV